MQKRVWIKNLIQQYRIHSHLSQKELAKALGISVSHLSKLENHKVNVSAELIYKVCKYFNDIEVGMIFYIDDVSKYIDQVNKMLQ